MVGLVSEHPHPEKRTESPSEECTSKKNLFGDPVMSFDGFSLVRVHEDEGKEVDNNQVVGYYFFHLITPKG